MSVYKLHSGLVSAGLSDGVAEEICGTLEKGLLFPAARFTADDVANRLFDAMADAEVRRTEKVEALTDLLRHCFWAEQFDKLFLPAAHSTALSQAGFDAAAATRIVDLIRPFTVTPGDGHVRTEVRWNSLKTGSVVMCDFRSLRNPEMQKIRRAIIISTGRRRSGRVIVVPVLPMIRANPPTAPSSKRDVTASSARASPSGLFATILPPLR